MTTQSSPVITDMKVIPVAGHDSMLLNIGGAHNAYFTRNIVVLTDNAGHTGVGEIPGAKKFAKRWKMRSHWWWEKRWVNIKMS